MFEEIVTKDGLKFNNLEKKIYKFVCMLGCFIIKYILESRDRKLMKARDSKKFRHKEYKNNCIKTIMGEVEYKRAVYLFEEDGEKKYVYLLDEDMKIENKTENKENEVNNSNLPIEVKKEKFYEKIIKFFKKIFHIDK